MQRFYQQQTERRTDFPPLEQKRSMHSMYPTLDPSTASTFIYCSNYEKREYQAQIALAAVKENTLVVLPTGLGKTLIAALLILNFYIWFPGSKIVFVAPTRPLAMQQFNSIRSSIPIPKTDIAELTGQTEPLKRADIWQTARVFFATPQTVQNDLEKSICPAAQIVLLVVDEAHRARGDHSYCQIVKEIASYTKFFRVMGLSATPGSTFEDVQQVVYGLMISRIEIRSERDCESFTFSRSIRSEVIPEAEGTHELVSRLNGLIKPFLVELLKLNLVPHSDPSRTSRGLIVRIPSSAAQRNCLKLLTLRESLQNYSIPVFVKSLRDFLAENDKLPYQEQLEKLLMAASSLPQTDYRMDLLVKIVVDFLTYSENSKVLVFCHYRQIVHDIVSCLSESSAVVKCAQFIGQANSAESRGLNQKNQIKVMELFKRGIYNVLVATAIGEEGLDIGEVDMVICYDVQKSLTRTIQRMGRTGRKRDGSVIFLLNESQKSFLQESEAAQNSFTTMIKRRMKDFKFYKGEVMNPSLLTVMSRFYNSSTDSAANSKKVVKRATLTTDEIDEMNLRHGPVLVYSKLSLSDNLAYQTSISNFSMISHSTESMILSNIITESLEYENDEPLSAIFGTNSTETTTTTMTVQIPCEDEPSQEMVVVKPVPASDDKPMKHYGLDFEPSSESSSSELPIVSSRAPLAVKTSTATQPNGASDSSDAEFDYMSESTSHESGSDIELSAYKDLGVEHAPEPPIEDRFMYIPSDSSSSVKECPKLPVGKYLKLPNAPEQANSESDSFNLN